MTNVQPRFPKDFDFDSLRRRIEEATVAAFHEVAAQHPSERICSFALYSDDGGLTVCPSIDTRTALETRLRKNDGDLYFKYGTAEWAFECVGAEDQFHAICRTLSEEVLAKEDDDDWHEWFCSSLFETCISALANLRGRNVFSSAAAEPELLLMFGVSDSDPDPEDECALVARLNSPSVAAEHAAWTRTWGQ